MNQVMEAYSYYKAIHKNCCIFFRIDNSYIAFFDDAKLVASLLGILCNDPTQCAIPSANVLDYVEKLYHNDVVCKLISYKDASGNYVLPDIEQIKSDKTEDY